MFTCNNCGGTIQDEDAIDSHVAKDTRIMYLLYLEQAMHDGGYAMTKAEMDELENYRSEGGAL